MACLYKSDLPYPESELGGKSAFEVRLLMPAYGGRDSETGAILGYIFQSYVPEETDPKIAGCLKSIAITEMHHHELLGNAIAALGGTPYIGDNKGFWQGGDINYSVKPSDMIDIDIRNERIAIRGYKDLSSCQKTTE